MHPLQELEALALSHQPHPRTYTAQLARKDPSDLTDAEAAHLYDFLDELHPSVVPQLALTWFEQRLPVRSWACKMETRTVARFTIEARTKHTARLRALELPTDDILDDALTIEGEYDVTVYGPAQDPMGEDDTCS